MKTPDLKLKSKKKMITPFIQPCKYLKLRIASTVRLARFTLQEIISLAGVIGENDRKNHIFGGMQQ